MTEIFKKYLEKYIELLVDKRPEFFIAIVDVEKEFAQYFLEKSPPGMSYQAVWVERRDYADAVRLRNEPQVRQLVLLSSDSVEMIDSLKDFVEYPVIPDDQEILWDCLQTAFELELDSECRKILGTVLEQKQISLEDLLNYIEECSENGTCGAEKMVRNLFRFEIWSMKRIPKGKKLSKRQLQRMIRNSNPLLVETRLLSGITGRKVKFSEKDEKEIIRCLSQNDLQRLFQKIPYDDRIEQLFKGNHRPRGERDKEQQEEQQYENSYQYAIQENIQGCMEEIEEELSAEEDSPLEESSRLFVYPETELLAENLREIKEEMKHLNFTDRKRSEILKGLGGLEACLVKAVERGSEYPPPYLFHYAEGQKEFIKTYFRFLGNCVADDGIVRNCAGTDLLSRIQCLFCKEENGELSMPFYHPLMGYYYWSLQEKFEEYWDSLNFYDDHFSQEAIRAQAQKEQMNFPIQYMLWNRQLYQLDYVSLQKWNAEVTFRRVSDHTAGSWIHIRVLNEDMMDYIARQPFLPEIRVTVVDLNDIREIMSMVEKLQRLPDSKECMVHKVILNIVSEKEEELKRQLQEFMEMDIDYPQVLFRFTRELYWKDNEYDLGKMIVDSDLLFLADSRLLYQKPRLSAWKGESNSFRIQMERLDVENLPDRHETQEENLLELLWDSIHHIELEEEAKITYWNTRELKPAIFRTIGNAIEKNSRLTVVVMSSNADILRHIYHISGFQARKSIVPGQEMLLLNFHKQSRRKNLKIGKKAEVRVALGPFLEGLLGVSEMESVLYTDKEKETPYLFIFYKYGVLGMRLEVCMEQALLKNQDRKEHYEELAEGLSRFIAENRWFKQKLITMLYERAESYEAALMVDYLERTDLKPEIQYTEKIYSRRLRRVTDISAVAALQDMLQFIRKQSSIDDEYTISEFQNSYQKEMLEDCLLAEETLHILEKDTRRKMQQLYEIMENTNE